MKLACYIKKEGLSGESRVEDLLTGFRERGHAVYPVSSPSDVVDGTDALLSLGGDGTFLAAARLAVPAGIPLLGVNFGRLGFLSENGPGELPEALTANQWTVEERGMLKVDSDGFTTDWPYALNEVAVFRKDAAMLGIDVELDGRVLPTDWADGLLVATSSGSTA